MNHDHDHDHDHDHETFIEENRWFLGGLSWKQSVIFISLLVSNCFSLLFFFLIVGL